MWAFRMRRSCWFSTTILKIVVEGMTLGVPHVWTLWLEVSKGILPEKHLAPKIPKIMAVNYCGRQLARRLGMATPAYHKKLGATSHPGAC